MSIPKKLSRVSMGFAAVTTAAAHITFCVVPMVTLVLAGEAGASMALRTGFYGALSIALVSASVAALTMTPKKVMPLIRSTAVSTCAAVLGGVVAGTPCLPIVLGLAAGLKAETAINTAIIAAGALLVVTLGAMAQSVWRGRPLSTLTNAVVTVAAAASLVPLWNNVTLPTDAQNVQRQWDILNDGRPISLFQQEMLMRNAICGTGIPMREARPQ